MVKQAALNAIELELSVTFQISRLNSALNAQARKIISRHSDLNLAQWRILHLVCWGVADTTTAVRKAAGIDKSLFSKNLSRLANEDLVKLLPCPSDKRQYRIEATKSGQALHARLSPDIDARRAHLMASLTEQEKTTLFHAIRLLESASKKTDFNADTEDASATGEQ